MILRFQRRLRYLRYQKYQRCQRCLRFQRYLRYCRVRPPSFFPAGTLREKLGGLRDKDGIWVIKSVGERGLKLKKYVTITPMMQAMACPQPYLVAHDVWQIEALSKEFCDFPLSFSGRVCTARHHPEAGGSRLAQRPR